jgi:hypothetical protein
VFETGARITDNTRILASFSHASKFKRAIFVNTAFRFLRNNS